MPNKVFANIRQSRLRAFIISSYNHTCWREREVPYPPSKLRSELLEFGKVHCEMHCANSGEALQMILPKLGPRLAIEQRLPERCAKRE
jgi:hypothetical protein